MKRLIRLIAGAAVCGVMGQTLHADLITGVFTFVGSVTLDTSSAGTATAVTGWIQPQISQTPPTGTFAAVPDVVTSGMAVVCTPISWNLTTSTPITNFWQVNGFTFELLSSYIVAQGGSDPGQNGYVVVAGTGVVSGNGFTPTAFGWQLITADPASGGSPESWSFSGAAFSQNSNGAPVLTSMTISNGLVLSWSDPTFTLQAGPAVNCSYADIPGATSPYTNLINGMQQFFRLRQ